MLHDLQMQALTRKICIFPFRVQTITDHPGPSADEAPTILALHVAGLNYVLLRSLAVRRVG